LLVDLAAGWLLAAGCGLVVAWLLLVLWRRVIVCVERFFFPLDLFVTFACAVWFRAHVASPCCLFLHDIAINHQPTRHRAIQVNHNLPTMVFDVTAVD